MPSAMIPEILEKDKRKGEHVSENPRAESQGESTHHQGTPTAGWNLQTKAKKIPPMFPQAPTRPDMTPLL